MSVRKAVVLSVLAVVSLVSVSVTAPALAAGEAASSVHGADAAWMKSYNAGELEKVVALYDENAVIYPPGAPSVHGRAAIKEFFTNDMAGFAKAGLVITIEGAQDGGESGNTGWSSGTWVVKDKDGKTVDSGWFFSVSKKVGGKWLYVRDAWNTNSPAAPAPTAPAGN